MKIRNKQTGEVQEINTDTHDISSGFFLEGEEIFTGDILTNDVAEWKVVFKEGVFGVNRINSTNSTTEYQPIPLRILIGAKKKK